MSLTPWQPTVRRIQDGERVEQDTVNTPIDQLVQRDQHLYEKFEEINGKSVLTSFGQPLHPSETFIAGELNVVYFKSDENGEGLAKSVTGFSSSSSSSLFSPNNSNYSFGIIKTTYTQSSTADLYTEGLCEFPIDIDNATFGLLQKQGNVVETFEVGPYYLSSKQPGKITKDPSGIPVYIGYAISKREFLLHTNVDEFSQFFINYRYHLVSKASGTPVETNGTWTINDSDTTKLGWIAASSSGVTVPEGAKFFYNIPVASISSDTSLTDAEKAEALELAKNTPPIPANFIQLFSDGSLVRYKDSYDLGGLYSVNEYGIWWYDDTVAPWESQLFTSFSKFNPALRTQLVSSLRPFNTLTNKSSNFIKFYGADNLLETATTGDLLVDVDPQFIKVGASTTFTSPVTTLANYTAGQAIAALEYDKAQGAFKTTLTPVVAKVQGVGDIGVTESETSPGVWLINYRAQGITGAVDSIEPVNARLEFVGLSSYIKLPAVYTTQYGLIGKILLPKGYLSGKPLRLVFHLFGDKAESNTSLNKNIAFKFAYTGVSAINGETPTSSNTVSAVTYGPTDPIEISLAPSSDTYLANTVRKITSTSLVIPAEYVSSDSAISFKIIRVAASTNNYTGNLGVIGMYWEIYN